MYSISQRRIEIEHGDKVTGVSLGREYTPGTTTVVKYRCYDNTLLRTSRILACFLFL